MTLRLSKVLLALVSEKLSRFNSYLEEVALICSTAELQLVGFFHDLLNQVNDREITRARRILSLPNLTPEDGADALESLLLTASHMDILLSETDVFPRGRPPPEVYEFLDKAFPNISSQGWQVAVVLWPIYNFGVDPDLAERLKEKLDWIQDHPPKHVVLYLAEIERNDPVMWSLLAHEMGHALDEAGKIREDFLKPGLPTQIDEYPRWITELIADNIAAKVLGPAYLCAFASMTLLDDNPRRYYSSHPALHKRVEMLKQDLELSGALGEKAKAVIDECYQLVVERTNGEPASAEDTMFNWNDIFTRVRGVVDSKVGEIRKFCAEDCETSEKLATLLREGLPISSFLDENRRRSINEKVNLLLIDLRETLGSDRQNRLGEFKRRLKEIVDEFAEKSTSPVCLLNAGWIDKWNRITQSPSSRPEWLPGSDTILKKSIEAIRIQEELGKE